YRHRGLLPGSRAPIRALNSVDLTAMKGRTLAIVGESGCGKSTLARVLAGLETASEGRVDLEGHEIASVPIDARPPALKRTLQLVFQNPDSPLNPSHTAGYAIGRALRRLRGLSKTQAAVEIAHLLDVVKLPRELESRKPDHLSGGQKQRVAI